ncbi:MAG: hypothetical protein QF371_04980 [Flavobacteriales bacterium]|jgi:hypothetical protein|nr:hypothetical protein [Flavobacteriales bacterium]
MPSVAPYVYKGEGPEQNVHYTDPTVPTIPTAEELENDPLVKPEYFEQMEREREMEMEEFRKKQEAKKAKEPSELPGAVIIEEQPSKQSPRGHSEQDK